MWIKKPWISLARSGPNLDRLFFRLRPYFFLFATLDDWRMTAWRKPKNLKFHKLEKSLNQPGQAQYKAFINQTNKEFNLSPKLRIESRPHTQVHANWLIAETMCLKQVNCHVGWIGQRHLRNYNFLFYWKWQVANDDNSKYRVENTNF